MTKYFLVSSGGHYTGEKARSGFAKALQIAAEEGLKSIVIVVPRIEGFERSHLGFLIDSLKIPKVTASRLRRHESVVISGINIKIVPSSKISKLLGYEGVDVLIAYNSTVNDMEEIGALYNIKNIVHIPWSEQEQEYAINKWKPALI